MDAGNLFPAFLELDDCQHCVGDLLPGCACDVSVHDFFSCRISYDHVRSDRCAHIHIDCTCLISCVMLRDATSDECWQLARFLEWGLYLLLADGIRSCIFDICLFWGDNEWHERENDVIKMVQYHFGRRGHDCVCSGCLHRLVCHLSGLHCWSFIRRRYERSRVRFRQYLQKNGLFCNLIRSTLLNNCLASVLVFQKRRSKAISISPQKQKDGLTGFLHQWHDQAGIKRKERTITKRQQCCPFSQLQPRIISI